MAGGVGLFRSRRDIAIRNQESDQTIKSGKPLRDFYIQKVCCNKNVRTRMALI